MAITFHMIVLICTFPQTTSVTADQPRVLPQVAVVEPKPKPKPAVLILALVLTVLCGLHLNLPAFVCLTPGLVFAVVVSIAIHVCGVASLLYHLGHPLTSQSSPQSGP